VQGWEVQMLKALYDYHPKELNNEQLNALYSALIAKLCLTGEELIERHERVVLAAKAQLEADALGSLSEAERQQHKDRIVEFIEHANRIKSVHSVLAAELAMIKSQLVSA
jgi:hypothetical protein